MRILMLGNSFTFYNDLPAALGQLTGAEVVHYTRGGARLAEFLNPATKMGGLTRDALRDEKWNYVVLQEMSNGPITCSRSFQESVDRLCERIRENGAVPVLYATWAYRRGSGKLSDMKMTYEEMTEAMTEAYHEAGKRNQALVADVGRRFAEEESSGNLYAADDLHPNEVGSRIAAQTLAEVILAHDRQGQ